MEKIHKDDDLVIDVRYSKLNIWKSISPKVPPLVFQGSKVRKGIACQYYTGHKRKDPRRLKSTHPSFYNEEPGGAHRLIMRYHLLISYCEVD